MSLLVALLPFVALAGQAGVSEARIPTWEQSYLEQGSMNSRALRAYGFCSAEGRREQIQTLLRLEPGADGEIEAIRAIDLDNYSCLVGGWTLRMRSLPLVRGVLAEHLYKRQRRSPRTREALPADGTGVVPLAAWHGVMTAPVDVADDSAVGRHVAACVTVREPGQVHQMVSYDSGSPGETRLLRALRPQMMSCLPDGAILRVSRLTMRAMLAEALYQASEAHPELFRNA